MKRKIQILKNIWLYVNLGLGLIIILSNIFFKLNMNNFYIVHIIIDSSIVIFFIVEATLLRKKKNKL